MSEVATAQTLPTPQRFFAVAQSQAERPGYFVRDDHGWRATSWSCYADQVRRAARALIALGVQHGDVVCILGFNRAEWVIMDLAAMAVGAAAAGIYWTSAPNEVVYILGHSRAPLLLVENRAQLDKLGNQRSTLDALRHVVMMRGESADDVLDWDAFLALGDESHTLELQHRLDAIRPTDLGCLIYTSGTTGPAKAVMLSHANLIASRLALCALFGASENDRLLSYLPLAHIAEQMGAIHNHAHTGYPLYFARSLEALPEHLREVHPTIFFGVPRVWEKIQAAIMSKLRAARGPKALLVRWAMRVARRWHLGELAGQPPGPWLSLQMQLARALLLDKVKRALGLDQARLLICGAAPVALDTLEFFAALDLPIRELYGQSEVCGPTTVSTAGNTRLGAVGKPVPGLDVRIADDGEIMVRGPSVFAGYLGRSDDTAACFEDGWMASGDLGRFDADGYLYVTGRKKDIIITSGGKNVSPGNLEADLMGVALIEHAVVCGDGRKFLCALLTLNAEALGEFAQQQGFAADGLFRHPLLHSTLEREIAQINTRHARVEGIRKFAVIERPLSIASGELTPTMKVRRQIVIERHHELIESLYRE